MVIDIEGRQQAFETGEEKLILLGSRLCCKGSTRGSSMGTQ